MYIYHIICNSLRELLKQPKTLTCYICCLVILILNISLIYICIYVYMYACLRLPKAFFRENLQKKNRTPFFKKLFNVL